jgi:hypothetical protein
MFLVLVASCTVRKRKFKAKPERQEKSVQQRIDGVFLAKHNYLPGEEEMEVFIFYVNGIVLQYYPIYDRPFIKTEDTSLFGRISGTIKYRDNIGMRKEAGGYSIDNKKVLIQVFRQTPGAIYSLCEYTGNMINDSSIFISNCKFPDNKNFCRENFYLSKIKMAKPDSTTRLIKKRWYWRKKD